jgi:hypothetical protein
MDNYPVWKFRIPGKDEINQDPTQEEFFTTQSVGDFSDALVRESIQNSLDAKSPKIKSDEAVTVRFFFSGKTNANNVLLDTHYFFKGIRDHIYASDNGLNKKQLPNFEKETEYLVIEDFNTSGLDGSIIENDDPKDRSPLGHNFYWFWRNVGRTGKTNFELGKWGLGKTVFPAASLINSFFGLTNRFDDNKNYLMGLSVLKTHHLKGEATTKRYPYGYFGNFSDPNFKYFATPSENEKIIEEFRKQFQLKRDNSTSGLSIVIPFPRKEITSISIIRSVLKQYFYPIISNKLVVEVYDNDNRIGKKIDKGTIFQILDELKLASDYEKLFKLCAWSLQVTDDDLIHLRKPPVENAPRWQMEWFLDNDIEASIKSRMNSFEDGSPVAFNVPVRIKETDGKPEMSFFRVFIEKDDTLSEPDTHFVRDGITITGIKKPKNKFLRGIIVIEEKKIVKLLGLSENPAHTEWQKDSSHFRGKYDDGDKVINFIELTFDKLCSLLIKPPEGIDREMMKDIFYIELNDNKDEESTDQDDESGEDSNGQKPPKTSPKKLPFILEKGGDGFILKKNSEINWNGGNIKIETAYMVVKGNPLKKYSSFDYDLSKPPIAVRTNGITNLQYYDNKISFDVESGNDFQIEVRGFDELRDLFIKANHYDSEI